MFMEVALAERKSMSKKLRFEVFKRDSFTCQYCGRSSPAVILHVDHIHPVSQGGTNDILNLVTSCADCNSGKGKRLLSDNTSMKKKVNQLKVLQEKQEQLDAMYEWQKSLSNLEDYSLNKAVEFYNSIIDDDYELSKVGEGIVRKVLSKYGLEETMECMKLAVENYPQQERVDYIGRIASTRHRYKDKPYMKDLFYVNKMLKNRFDFVYKYSLAILEKAYLLGVDVDELKDIAIASTSVSGWKRTMNGIIEHLEQEMYGEIMEIYNKLIESNT